MNGARAGVRRLQSRLPAPSSNSRRSQAGDAFSHVEAPGGALDGNAWGREESEGHAPSWPQESHVGAYTVILPNPTKRNQLQKIATKELEELEKWKEQHRPRLINLPPQKLGGRAMEADVRQKQQLEHTQAKYQQKLKREEYGRLQREAEDADILSKKAIQRAKANKLEENRRQQEWQRRQMLDEDNYLRTTEFLNRLDSGLSRRNAGQTDHSGLDSTAWARSHTYKQIQRQEEERKLQEMKDEQRRKAELLEYRQNQKERLRMEEQRRVNNAFLDRLQSNRHLGIVGQSGCLGNTDSSVDSWDS